MGKIRVLDAWTLVNYFEGQAGCEKVTEIFKEASRESQSLLMTSVNWGEVLYIVDNRRGGHKRDQVEHLMEQMNLEIVEVDKLLAKVAAGLKAAYKLPYQDSFAAALAIQKDGELVTGDKDFRLVESRVKIVWI